MPQILVQFVSQILSLRLRRTKLFILVNAAFGHQLRGHREMNVVCFAFYVSAEFEILGVVPSEVLLLLPAALSALKVGLLCVDVRHQIEGGAHLFHLRLPRSNVQLRKYVLSRHT